MRGGSVVPPSSSSPQPPPFGSSPVFLHLLLIFLGHRLLPVFTSFLFFYFCFFISCSYFRLQILPLPSLLLPLIPLPNPPLPSSPVVNPLHFPLQSLVLSYPLLPSPLSLISFAFLFSLIQLYHLSSSQFSLSSPSTFFHLSLSISISPSFISTSSYFILPLCPSPSLSFIFQSSFPHHSSARPSHPTASQRPRRLNHTFRTPINGLGIISRSSKGLYQWGKNTCMCLNRVNRHSLL